MNNNSIFESAGSLSTRLTGILTAAGLDQVDLRIAVECVHTLGHAHQKLGFAAAQQEDGIPRHGFVMTPGTDVHALASEFSHCAMYAMQLARALDAHLGGSACVEAVTALHYLSNSVVDDLKKIDHSGTFH